MAKPRIVSSAASTPSASKLITLADYEKQVFLKWNPTRVGETPNGIECPHCGNGTELMDDMFKMTSNPPRLKIHCNGCDFIGTRTLSPGEV